MPGPWALRGSGCALACCVAHRILPVGDAGVHARRLWWQRRQVRDVVRNGFAQHASSDGVCSAANSASSVSPPSAA